MSLERLLGHALRKYRPGMRSIASHCPPLSWLPDLIRVESTSFQPGAALPARYSRHGEGINPALRWSGAPAETAAYAVLIEDADSPMPRPFVHGIVVDLPAAISEIAEGTLPRFGSRDPRTDELRLGLNSVRSASYMAPRPISGHGPHRYVFQVYALSRALGVKHRVGRGELVEGIANYGLARGEILGVYERP